MRSTSRRSSFLGYAAASAFFSLLPGRARPAQFTYKIGVPDGVDFPEVIGLIQTARRLRDESGGRFELQVYPDSALGSPTAMLSQLRFGALEMVSLNHSLFATITPVAQITGLGFAFANSALALRASDGKLGEYIRRELTAKDMYVFPLSSDAGFKEIESGVRPVRNADDFVGFRVRSIPAPISVELYKALGAAPVPLEGSEIFTALQSHLVDGVDESLASVDGHRLYEAVKYASITNHSWSGHWTAIHTAAWKALPEDLQSLVSKNFDRHLRAERAVMRPYTDAIIGRLKSHGMAFNTIDPASVRPRLNAYYTRWRSELGSAAWSLLEGTTGKLI